VRSSARRHDYKDIEEWKTMASLRCPACNNLYADDLKERLIPFNSWTYNVCPACFVAYLKVRVKNGERLTLEELHTIGKVRTTFKKSGAS
jgi:hypothetical protein